MRDVEEFKTAAREKDITKWVVNDCSICGYQCAYLIRGDEVYYDAGCGCVYYPPHLRSWQDIADSYNMQKSPEYIKEMDEFWGFK